MSETTKNVSNLVIGTIYLVMLIGIGIRFSLFDAALFVGITSSLMVSYVAYHRDDLELDLISNSVLVVSLVLFVYFPNSHIVLVFVILSAVVHLYFVVKEYI